MLVGPKAAETLQPGSHGSTFGGNPIAAAVARVVLRKLRSAELLANVERQGERLRKRLTALHNEIGFISEVRGRGLMLGAVLRDEWAGRAGELGEVCRRHGVLVLQAGADVIRFLPPLNITGRARRRDGSVRGDARGCGRRTEVRSWGAPDRMRARPNAQQREPFAQRWNSGRRCRDGGRR